MEEINIKEYFYYLKKYIWVFIVFAIIAVAGVIGYDKYLKKPMYQAETTVVIAKSEGNEGAAATLNEVNASQKLVTTYGEIAKSELVLNQVITNLDLMTSAKRLSGNVSVKAIPDTTILKIQAKDESAAKSASIANEIAKVFMEEVAKIYKLDNISQLSVASAPTAPFNNTMTRDIVLAVAIVAVAVAGFAFVRFYLDDTVKHSDDIERLFGLPIAGKITKNDTKSRKNATELIVARSPKAIVSENIKSLRTNLQFTAIDKFVKTILVTSVNAGEGKSFVSANLAVSFAQAGKKVLLVDCDLRKGRAHKLFMVLNKKGLSNLLTDNLRNLDSYINHTSLNNLDVITCGTYPPNPSELLSSLKNRRLVKLLRANYDIVIFDGAPVGALADSIILSSLVDETIIVTKDGNTSKADLLAAKNALSKVGANIAGIVFNMINRKSSGYYYYYGSDKKQ